MTAEKWKNCIEYVVTYEDGGRIHCLIRVYVSQSDINKLCIISSTLARHRAGSRDEMRWSPFTEGLRVARMSADHAPSQGRVKWNEMKRNVWDECGEMVEWNLWKVKTGETPRKTYPNPFRPPRNPHGVTETRTRDPNGGKRASNRFAPRSHLH